MRRLALLLALAACVTEPAIETTLRLSDDARIVERVHGQTHCDYTLHFEGAGIRGGYVTLDHAQVEVWGDGKLQASWETGSYLTPPTVHVAERRSSKRWAYVQPPVDRMEVRYRWWYIANDGAGHETHTVECRP